MLNESEFLQGIVPDITWCLGVRLRPLSIGSRFLLKRLQSPFLGYPTDGEPFTYQAVREAIIVLAHRRAEAMELFGSPRLTWYLRKWHWGISCFGIRSIDLRRAAMVLCDHIWKAYEFCPVPLSNSSADGPSEMASPQDQILLVTLMEKLNMGIEEALDLPLSMAHWLHGTMSEKTGACTLSTPEGLKEAKRQADEQHAKIAELIAKGVFVRPSRGGG